MDPHGKVEVHSHRFQLSVGQLRRDVTVIRVHGYSKRQKERKREKVLREVELETGFGKEEGEGFLLACWF